MKKLSFSLVLILLLVGIGTFAFSNSRQYFPSIFETSNKPQAENPQSMGSINLIPQMQKREIPEYVLYTFLFMDAVNVKKAGMEQHFLRETQLSPNEFNKLVQIAEEFQKSVSVLDERAKTVVEESRRKYPDRKIPQGQPVPKISAEIQLLQENRNQTVLRFRDRIRSEMDQSAFSKIDFFVKKNIKSKIK